MRTFGALTTDAVIVIYVYVGTVLGRVYLGAPPEMIRTMAVSLIPFVLAHVVCLGAFSAYDFRKTRTATDLAFSAGFGIIAGTMASFLLSAGAIVYYTVDAQPIGRSVFGVACFLNGLALCGWRAWYTWERRASGELGCKVLVVGTPEEVAPVSQEINEYSRSGHHVVGYVVTEPAESPLPKDCLGGVSALPRLVEEHAIDEILLLGNLVSEHSTTLLDIIQLSEGLHLRLHVVPGLYESLVGKLDLYEIGGIPLIEFKQTPISGTYAVVKRAMDVCCALVGLVLSLPVLAAAAIALKLDSKGPIFYRQVRSGRGGRPFNIIKLRTMHVNAEVESGPVRAGKDDSRVTRVGRFLRTQRIDEIPQLWNVLKGDMSLVGPRPERPFFVDQFTKEVPLFPLRLRVRPGVTALSHVWGRYTSTPIDRLRYDLVYMSNISFMLDARILLDTVKTVLTGRGAQ